jgi:hypothetical protein
MTESKTSSITPSMMRVVRRSQVLAATILCYAIGSAAPLPAYGLEPGHIKTIEAAVVKHICSDPAWVTCWGEQTTDCSKLIGDVAQRCLENFLAPLPTGVKYEQAQAAGLKAITCINVEFAANRPLGKKDSPECQQIPAHLQ